jgi:excisionase family DNA binding protein
MSDPRPARATRRLLTLPEAATYLGLSTWTVRDLTWKGRLPVVRITRKLLFDLRDLDALIDQEKM